MRKLECSPWGQNEWLADILLARVRSPVVRNNAWKKFHPSTFIATFIIQLFVLDFYANSLRTFLYTTLPELYSNISGYFQGPLTVCFAEDKHCLCLKCRTGPQTVLINAPAIRIMFNICEIRLTKERVSIHGNILIKAQPSITVLIIYLFTWRKLSANHRARNCQSSLSISQQLNCKFWEWHYLSAARNLEESKKTRMRML